MRRSETVADKASQGPRGHRWSGRSMRARSSRPVPSTCSSWRRSTSALTACARLPSADPRSAAAQVKRSDRDRRAFHRQAGGRGLARCDAVRLRYQYGAGERGTWRADLLSTAVHVPRRRTNRTPRSWPQRLRRRTNALPQPTLTRCVPLDRPQPILGVGPCDPCCGEPVVAATCKSNKCSIK